MTPFKDLPGLTARNLAFGRQASIGSLAVTAYWHSDVIVVGRMLGDSALGTYRMALYLAGAPAEKISTLIMRTAGPLFANLQSDPPLVRRYFLLLLETLNLAVVPAMIGLVMVAPEAVHVLLGPKWAAAATPVLWLALYMMVSTMSALVTQVLVSLRETRFTIRISLANLLVMPIAFVVGARLYGTSGVAAAWLIAAPLTALPSAVFLLHRIGLPWRDYLLTLWPTAVSASAMALTLAGLKTVIRPYQLAPPVHLGVQVAVGAAVYSGTLLICFREKIQRYVSFLQDLRAKAPDTGNPT